MSLQSGTGRRRIRILHVVLNLHEGGLERVVGDLLRWLDPSAFEPHVLCLQFLGRLSAGLSEHATMHVAQPMPAWSMLRPSGLARQIRAIAPDVLHTHSGLWYKASLAARMAGVPFLLHTDHGRQSPDPRIARLLDGLASRRSDVVIAVSETLGRQLAETVVHDPSRIRVLPNGVDTQIFRPGGNGLGIRHELGILPETPVIGSIGRLDPIKRFDLMLEAFSVFLSRWEGERPPHLIIAGGGPERVRLDTLSKKLGVTAKVHLLGWREDVRDLHAAFDLFTMSSRSEGTSIGLLEAMSAGLCPVVTDVGGNRAVLGEKLAHRLCASENPDALIAAWSNALDGGEERRADGIVARARVEEVFSVQAMVREHERIYRSGFDQASRSQLAAVPVPR